MATAKHRYASMQTKTPPQNRSNFIISVMNYKGGVGKSTTAIHLSYALAMSGRGNVVLVDADPNRSSIAGLGAVEYSEAVPLQVVNEFEALALKDSNQFVVDTKARPSEDDLQSIVRSSTLIIVPTATVADEIRVTLDTIRLLQNAGADQYRVLLTKAPTSFNSARIQEARDLLKQFNVPTFQSVIRSYIAYNDAFAQRIPVCNLKGGSAGKAWADYKDLAKEVIQYVK